MVGQRNMLDNRKSQANAVTGMLILIAAAIEPFKNTVLFADGDAFASIENTDYRFRMLLIGFGDDIHRRTVF